jgi:hypothetical protein
MVTQPDQSPSPSKTNKQQWVLLSYKVPREPSTPRIAIWRRLKKAGVAQIGDGLVGLPLDARTKESLEWVAAMVLEADGDAIVWIATTTKQQDRELAAKMNDERDEEYRALIAEIEAAGAAVNARTIARLRREWRRITRRDYFRSSLRESARQALRSLSPQAADELAADMDAIES